jgi:hypothetical protein
LHFAIRGTTSGLALSHKLTLADWKRLAEAIKQDYGRYGRQMGEIRRQMRCWTVFVNPFRRVQTTIFGLEAQLQLIKSVKPETLDVLVPPKRSRLDQERMTEWSNAMFLTALYTTSIRMLAPVMAEAVVNFFVFVLAKNEVRADPRLYDNFIRQPVDVRVKSLHLYCEGFRSPVGGNDPAYAAFRSLMNGRNEFLHANVDPKRLAVDQLFVDDSQHDEPILLFKDDGDYVERYIRQAQKFVEPSEAANDVAVGRRFFRLLLSHLNDSARRKIGRLVEQRYLGWNERTGELSGKPSEAIERLVFGKRL